MALTCSDFLDYFIIDTFLMKVTQFEKTGSIGKVLIQLRNLKIKIHTFETRSCSRFFASFPRSYLESTIYPTFGKYI